MSVLNAKELNILEMTDVLYFLYTNLDDLEEDSRDIVEDRMFALTKYKTSTRFSEKQVRWLKNLYIGLKTKQAIESSGLTVEEVITRVDLSELKYKR